VLAAAVPQAPADSSPASVGPGISEALAQARAATTAEVSYDLALDITSPDSALGRVTVTFRRTGTGDAVLDFRGRRLGAVAVNGVALTRPTARHGHLILPAARLRGGENTVTVEFVADIASTGASIIRSDDRSDGSTYLYTLLVPADANQLFPCFDQPDL
jgi:aminopeptidase N